MQGSGTQQDPYLVATAQDLNDVRNDLSAYYLQTADIDLSEYGDWIPIGEFNGVYDGNNFTISNLTVPLGDESIYYSWGLFEGIFGFWDMDFPENSVPAEVKNLTLENVDITGDYNVGALAGYSYGKITNCHSSGTVRGQFNVGGLLGSSYELSNLATEYQSDIIGCSSSCTIERIDFTTYAYYFGGLIGSANNLRIEQCFATGDIIINDNHLRNCGGLLGTASPWNIPLDMRMTIKDCYATGNIQGDYNCGGMVGYTYTCDLINCYSSGSVNGVEDIGGFIGYMDETSATTSCYYDSQASGQSDTGKGIPKTTEEMALQETYVGWDFENIWVMASGYPQLRWAAITSYPLQTGKDYVLVSPSPVGTMTYNGQKYEFVRFLERFPKTQHEAAGVSATYEYGGPVVIYEGQPYHYLASGITDPEGPGGFGSYLPDTSRTVISLADRESFVNFYYTYPQLPQVAKPVWVKKVITWKDVPNANFYKVTLYNGAQEALDTKIVAKGIQRYDYTDMIENYLPAGSYTCTVQALEVSPA